MNPLLRKLYFWDAPEQGAFFGLLRNIINKARYGLILLALSVLLCPGCVNGPARCHLNGRFNYLTAETAKRTAWYTYPVTLPTAAICDAVIIVADTIAVPVLSLGHLGPDGKSHPVYSIFWLPFYPLVCFTAMLFSLPGNALIVWSFNFNMV